MSKQNRELFDSYPDDSYFKTNQRAIKHFKELYKFPNALGYDIKTDGFIVLHHKHQESGIADEMPACLILKQNGFGVELNQESGFIPKADATIEERFFEIKCIKQAENLDNAVKMHFRRSHRKANCMILHILQRVNHIQLKKSLRIHCKDYKSIKIVWLIYENRLFQLSREVIITESYSLK
jgi:hypothetical protein